ncbi:MAG: PTS sugar transporter subunit IIA [Candidatus Spyradenecus sp.]
MNTYDTMLDKAVVVTSLRSEDIFGVIAELMDALVAAGALSEAKKDEAKQAIVRREMSASTVMTDEIALPHGRTDVVEELVCAIGVHKEGFAADAPDGEPTKVVILMLVPPSAGSGYMVFLGSISRKLMDPTTREAIISAPDRAAVLAALRG